MKFQRLILISCLIGGIVFATPASASNFSGPTGATGCGPYMVNMQDNSTMTYARVNLTSQFYNAVAFALNTDVAPTDVTVAAELSAPDGNTDVVFYDGLYSTFCGLKWGNPNSPSIAGAAICQTLSGSKCQQSNVRFSEYFATASSVTYVRALACHEIGHTLGLLHREENTGCMPEGASLSPFYTPHDIVHLNANY
jgi:hypothetical protein